MSLLIVNLHMGERQLELETLDWALFDQAGVQQQGGVQVAAESFNFVADTQVKCVVLAPAEQVLTTQIPVSPKQRRHLQKFLPFLVEEAIAEPIEEMHLVQNKITADGCAEVLAVHHSNMKFWLQACDHLKITPDWLIPESSAITSEQDELVIFLDEKTVLIQSAATTLKSSTLNLASLMELIASNADILKKISRVRLVAAKPYAEKKAAELAALQTQFESEGKSVVLEIRPSLFEYLCEELCGQMLASANSATGNLLQGDYRPAQQSNRRSTWRFLGYAAAACVLLQLFFNLSMGLYLENKARGIEQQIVQRYRDLFPQDRKIVDVKVQMGNHLKQLGDAAADAGFMQMMGVVGYQIQTMHEPQNLQIQQVRYDEGQGSMMLDIDVRQIQQLDQFKQALSEQGLAVTILSATEDQSWVKGRLRVDREA